MKNNKLISMVDFVLEALNEDPPYNHVSMLTNISNYANFLSRPLELGMFVPTDENGNVLTDIEKKEAWFRDIYGVGGWKKFIDYKVKYQNTKKRVLFEGFFENGTGCAVFHQSPNAIVIDFKSTRMRTIEDLLSSKCDFTLTQSAINQITS